MAVKYTGAYNLEGPLILNEKLLQKMRVVDREQIYSLHDTKRRVFKQMIATPVTNRHRLWEKAKQVTEIEYLLQSAWGWDKDSRYHAFWDLPHCICQRGSDYNNSRYAALLRGHIKTPRYTMRTDCVIHGFPDFLKWWNPDGLFGEIFYYHSEL